MSSLASLLLLLPYRSDVRTNHGPALSGQDVSGSVEERRPGEGEEVFQADPAAGEETPSSPSDFAAG